MVANGEGSGAAGGRAAASPPLSPAARRSERISEKAQELGAGVGAKKDEAMSWWQVELGLLVGVSLLCLFVFPVAVPVLVPLWIFRTCVYFGLSLCFAFCLVTGVMSIHVCELWFGWDPLALPMINGELVSIDSWSFIHILSFAFLGYLYPDQIMLMTLYGVLWEGVEFALSTDHDFWGERGINTVWDIFFNTFGYRLGEFLFILYGPSEEVEKLASYQQYVEKETKRKEAEKGASNKTD